MLFRISRTSETEPPCKGTIKGNEDFWGQNIWTIEINSIEELHELSKTEGKEIIIGEADDCEKIPYLEIYDTWRE